MTDYPPAPVPDRPTKRNLAAAIGDCRACDLWQGATQPVIGEGPGRARLMMGAVAAQALLGSHVRIGRDRGQPLDSELAELVMITTHPSAVLRSDAGDRRLAMDTFVADLELVAAWLTDH